MPDSIFVCALIFAMLGWLGSFQLEGSGLRRNRSILEEPLLLGWSTLILALQRPDFLPLRNADKIQAEAADAIPGIGTRGIPTLLKLASVENTRRKRKNTRFFSRLVRSAVHYTPKSSPYIRTTADSQELAFLWIHCPGREG
jgi:hypothetical protein